MSLSAIVIGEVRWWVPAAVIGAAAILLLAWAYRSLTVSGRVRLIAGVLKAAALSVLTVCLVEPLWSGVQARPGANSIVLLADNSRSLQVRDPGQTQSRGERLREALRTSTKSALNWQVRLEQNFDVRRDVFDARLRSVDRFDDLTFDGDGSSLGAALDAIRERYRGRPIGGVLLFTDGIATDLRESKLDLTGLPPVSPVVLGAADSPVDVALQNVTVSQTSFEDAPVTVQADVVAQGVTNAELAAQLVDESGSVVARATAPVADPSRPNVFRFQFRPSQPGVSFFRLQIALRDELTRLDESSDRPAFELPATTREATLANNTRLIQVDRGAGRQRILYVSGRPNWEFKFLRRALEDDDQIDLVGLIRVAQREAKFDFRGRADESSNPLFRGFKKIGDEETERFDEPVLLRLNTKDAAELRGGFPKSADELFGFSAVILDDVEAEFFTHDQIALLRRFVSERGGGLMMLGGAESFQAGGYRHSPLADALPVYLDPAPEREPDNRTDAAFRIELTRDGWLQPWMRLRSTEADERLRLEQMPSLRTVNLLSRLKPGVSVPANVIDGAGTAHPALATHRFGRGRCAALMVGDLWRWRLRRSDDDDDQPKAWRQLLRWLVADVPDRLEAVVKRSVPETSPVGRPLLAVDTQTETQSGTEAWIGMDTQSGTGKSARPTTDAAQQTVHLQVRVRDPNFHPLENATVRVTIHPPQPPRDPIRIQAEPSLEEIGVYQVTYSPREAGAYRATMEVTDGDGANAGTCETAWVSDASPHEFRSIAPDRGLLTTIAERTGGEVLSLDDLDTFVAGLAARPMPVMEQWTHPLWDRPWVFLFAVSCLIGEWGLRRWKGLP